MWKAHLVLTMCTVNTLFPLHLWCRLLEKIVLMLNHLHTSNPYFQLSAYCALCGQFDFDHTPTIPPGTHSIIHKTPNQQKSFSIKDLEGWYIVPVTGNYRCYIFVNKTRKIRVCELVEFIPHNYKLLVPNAQDCTRIVAFVHMYPLSLQTVSPKKSSVTTKMLPPMSDFPFHYFQPPTSMVSTQIPTPLPRIPNPILPPSLINNQQIHRHHRCKPLYHHPTS